MVYPAESGLVKPAGWTHPRLIIQCDHFWLNTRNKKTHT